MLSIHCKIALFFLISLFCLSAILKIRNGEHAHYVGLVVAYTWNREKQMFVALGKEFDMFAGGKTGFDLQETKLPTYWDTPFSKICLGIKTGHQLRFIVINRHANSLFSLIADGLYRATSLGRNTWKTLIDSQASLQPHCNKEGFNALGDNPRHSQARISIIANQENDCITCDSRIGLGTGGVHDDSNTCGNEADASPDNGNKHIKAMGYILVQ